MVPWERSWPSYKHPNYLPVEFTSEVVLAQPPWADPSDAREVRGLAQRMSFEQSPLFILADGRPRNPRGRTGTTGRGLLGKWGPNHVADPIVMRQRADGTLAFVAIQRRDTLQWAIPGGMVDPGERVSATLKREFAEEAAASTDAAARADMERALNRIFATGEPIYEGYVDDPRNTDNAWIETTAHLFLVDEATASKFTLTSGDDARAVKWIAVDESSLSALYADHRRLVLKATDTARARLSSQGTSYDSAGASVAQSKAQRGGAPQNYINGRCSERNAVMSSAPSPRSQSHAAPDTARAVQNSAGTRTPGNAAAGVRRPLVAYASFVPSDVESPRYGLPSQDYVRRFRQTAAAEEAHFWEGAAAARVAHAPELAPHANPPPVERRSRSNAILIVILVLVATCVLGILAMLAWPYLNVGDCVPDDHASARPMPAHCYYLASAEPEACPAPAEWTAPDANSTMPACCMPSGYVCSLSQMGGGECQGQGLRLADATSAAEDSPDVPSGRAEHLCCYRDALGGAASDLLKLDMRVESARAVLSELTADGIALDDLQVAFWQLESLQTTLERASTVMPQLLETVRGALAAAEAEAAAAEVVAANRTDDSHMNHDLIDR